MQSSTAANLQAALIKSLLSSDFKKILQVFKDSPNINFKLLKDLKAYLSEVKKGKTLIDFGRCSFHTLHTISSTGWNLIKFFMVLYYFHLSIKKSSPEPQIQQNSPKKCCALRWVENADVAQRRCQDIKKYVSTINKVKTIGGVW